MSVKNHQVNSDLANGQFTTNDHENSLFFIRVTQPDGTLFWPQVYTIESTIKIEPAEVGASQNGNRVDVTKGDLMKNLKITVTPKEELKEKNPQALVTIDGKTYDLNYLANPFNVSVGNRNVLISIRWSDNVQEQFVLVCQ